MRLGNRLTKSDSMLSREWSARVSQADTGFAAHCIAFGCKSRDEIAMAKVRSLIYHVYGHLRRMRMRRIGMYACVGLVAVCLVRRNAQETKDGIQIQSVKYDGLKEFVQKNRGKVVLVDFWGDFCLPCKKN